MALESERGTTVWERYIAMEAVDAGKVSGEAVVEGGELLVVRTTAEQYPAVVMVKLTVNTLDGKSATIMHMINAMDGTDFGRDPMTIFETEIASTMELPIVVGEEQIHPVVAIDANKRLRIVPESATIASTFLGFAPRISFFVGEVGGSCITGFRVDVGASASRAIQSWKLDFPAGERVVAIGKKPAYGKSEAGLGMMWSLNFAPERVASIGRVRGDRSVLYKYLNPHLAVFGTVREDPNVFSVYVVDVTKGSVLYHAAHSGGGMKTAADPSIHIAQAEHWIVYSFWNTGTSDMSNAAVAAKTDFGAGGDGGKKKKKKKASRRKPPVSKGQEIVALELYESGQPDSKLSPNSSQVLVRPFVLSQAYQLQTAVDALGITTTRSGITTREALGEC